MMKAHLAIFAMLGFAGSLSVPLLVHGADLNDVRESLVEDIQISQQALSLLESEIGEQRLALSLQVNALQNSVLELRERSVASRRLADEETLSLSRIEDRLAQWQEQSLYQTRLLQGFITRTNQQVSAQQIENPMDYGIEGLSRYLQQQTSRLYPSWQQEQLVMSDGLLAQAEMLQLGPVNWFRRGVDSEQVGQVNSGLVESGLVDRNSADELSTVSLVFSGDRADGLQFLYELGQGQITFDPTLSTAILLNEANESVIEHIQKGGIWVIPILLFALFASITAIFKGLSLWRLPKQLPALAERLEKACASGEAAMEKLSQQLTGTQALLLSICMQPLSSEQRDEKLYACLLDARNHLESWLGAIALTASVSPLLGLLGTVSGMIATFKLMTLFGSGDVNSVSAGISEALVTTELGLVVAIPALLAHALMSRKVKSYYSQLETTAIHLSQLQFKDKDRPTSDA